MKHSKHVKSVLTHVDPEWLGECNTGWIAMSSPPTSYPLRVD